MVETIDVAVIGAGPYGLAAAARLRRAGVEVRIFDRRPMSFWEEHMPKGMLLRSAWEASHIGYSRGALTLHGYQTDQCVAVPEPVPVEQFVEYGRWFERRAVGEIDRRDVANVDLAREGFRLCFAEGEEEVARQVIVATGIAGFASIPTEFAGLSREQVSHSVDHADLGRFAGQDVMVVGGGQSALESAALLRESQAASVEVIVRRPHVNWLGARAALAPRLGPLRPLLYPQTDVGPPGLNLVVARPKVLRAFPHHLREAMAERSIRPAGAAWLRPRLAEVPIRTASTVSEVRPVDGRLEIVLSGGTTRSVDHLLLATGYEVDVASQAFLSPRLRAALGRADGYPVLGEGFESTVPGLYFVGASAARSFGPLMRFVSGTWYASESVTRRIAHGRASRNGRS